MRYEIALHVILREFRPVRPNLEIMEVYDMVKHGQNMFQAVKINKNLSFLHSFISEAIFYTPYLYMLRNSIIIQLNLRPFRFLYFCPCETLSTPDISGPFSAVESAWYN